MEFKKNSLFSWLFGADKEKDKEVSPEPQPASPASNREAPSQQPLENQPGPAPRQLQNLLHLPPDHPLYELWRQSAGRPGLPHMPCFCLDAPRIEPTEGSEEEPVDLLPQREVEQELFRLKETLRRTSEWRLKKIQTQLQAQAQAQGPDETELPPPVSLDAEAVVFVPTNKLTAWLLLYPPYGDGAELTREKLDQVLEANHVTFGVDTDLLDLLPGASERYFYLFLIACGKPAVHGKNGKVVEMFARKVKPSIVEDEFGRVNYTELNLFQNVKEGEVICRTIPPTPRIPGRNIYDQEIPAREGLKATISKGRNTVLSEDGSVLTAGRSGHVEFSGRSFQVKPVLDISGDVDWSTGNINAVGDVHIHGNVRSGFVVRAMGSITVDGVVEGCTIEASGDLIVNKGVQGNSQAVLHTHRSLYAKYLENSCVYVHEALQAECIIHCDVYSDGVVQVRAGRGAIIGGQVHAAQEISANIVGAKSECKTAIFLGGKPCEDFERETIELELHDLEAEFRQAKCQPESPAKLKLLSKLRLQISTSRMKLQQFDKKVASEPAYLQQQAKRHLICGVVYPGTEITIDRVPYRVEHETHQCMASLVDGQIVLF